MMKLKFCGFTRKEDIEKVKQLNVDAVGFIHYPNSKRHLPITMINELMKSLPVTVEKVVVVVNPSRTTIDALANYTAMTTIQLHGNEPLETIQYIRAHYPDLRIIKALSARNQEELQRRLDQYRNQVDEFIIDTPSQDYGGTGQTYDWEILSGIHDVPFIIAGGLNYDHIQTIKQMDLNHHGYDIASGIETEGRKDLDKMRRIIESVKGVTKYDKLI